MNRSKHQHGEAYCLMQYYAPETGEREVLWNSRDGVTPFIIPSRMGAEMRHVNFHSDRYSPLHVPSVGDRIFVDLTEARARVIAARALERPNHLALMQQEYASRAEAIAGMARSMLTEHGGGRPDILVVTAGWIEQLHAARAALEAP